MTTQQTRHTPHVGAVQLPPYTWAGRAWRTPSSFLPPLVPPALFGLTVLIAHAVNWPAWALLPGCLIILAAAVTSIAGERYAQATQIYMITMGAYWSLWFGWASTDYAWRAATVASGAEGNGTFWWSLSFYLGGMFLTFLLWPSVRRAQIHHESRQYAMRMNIAPAQLIAAPDAMDGDSDRGRQWEARFASLGKKGLKFCDEVATPAGISVHMRLPVPGVDPTAPAVSFGAINTPAFIETIEQALELRPGAVRFERYRNPANRQLSSLDFWMHLDYEDILAKIVRMPEIPDNELMISINEAFPIGRMADGEYLYLTLREIHTMMVGVTRAGKSNLLHVIIYHVSRCYDAAIWMIDLKGGATARPWLQPWLDGKVDRPILDWVAIDRWEAARMMHAVVDIVKDRPGKRRGSKTEPQRKGMPMRTLDPATGKPRIAPINRPAVVLITDELAELVGTHTGPTMAGKNEGLTSATFASLMLRIVTLAAGEAFYAIFAGQGSTADVFGSPTAQKNIRCKIAVGQMDRQTAGMVFGNNNSDAVEAVYNLEHPGSIVVWKADIDRIMPTKAIFAGDDDELDAFCYRAAMRHHGLPATIELDVTANRLANEWGYADRWTDPDRYGWLLLGDDQADDEGGVSWEGKPLPLDATNKPIPLSKWTEQQERLEQINARTAGQADTGAASATEALAVLDATKGARGFWPQDPTPATPPAPAPGEIKTDPGAVDKMLEGLAAYLQAPTEPATDADDDTDDTTTGQALKVLKVAQIIDGYGHAGVGATDLARDMIAASLITEKGRKGYRRLVKKAMEDGAVPDPMMRVVQPGGAYGHYYTHRHTIISR